MDDLGRDRVDDDRVAEGLRRLVWWRHRVGGRRRLLDLVGFLGDLEWRGPGALQLPSRRRPGLRGIHVLGCCYWDAEEEGRRLTESFFLEKAMLVTCKKVRA